MHTTMRGRLARAVGRFVLAAALLAVAAAPAHAATPQATPRAATAEIPPGVSAGIAVYDRLTGSFTEQHNAHTPFRAASVVKVLIALDHLWNRGPAYSLPADDRARLDSMLRASNDDAARHYWSLNGGSSIIDRMSSRLGLVDTAGPPAGYPLHWGYTALSAADTVQTYRWILERAPATLRDIVMGNLRASTRCGTDGFDQRFGIPASFERPWAVKQGWSGFGPKSDCTNTTATTTASAAPSVTATPATGTKAAGRMADVDLSRPALHTTGTLGADDRSIVAVFTLHPQDTSFGAAYTATDRLVRSLNVPGATPRDGAWFGTWGSQVQVRAGTSTTTTPLTKLPAGVEVLVGCQKQGQQVTVPPYTNDWWAYLPLYDGYVTNIYMSSPDNKLPGVPLC
ncbi:hypothetical protein [Streptomyces pristinaespiralis]|uniref:hypothetical protein n=1 Tax=Streptomyces pristinaespiralis TaxID=38300 RepID=UPI003838F5AF